MKKQYSEPEFDLLQFKFETILEEHLIEHSKGEIGVADGDEGLD